MENNKQNTIDELKEYREKLSKLTEEEQKQRDLYLKKLADGTLQGPELGKSSIDKPWLQYYSDENIMKDSPKMCVFDYVKECNKNRQNNVALNYYGVKITFQEMFQKVEEAKKAFLNKGIKKGDKVSVALPTMPETFYTFFALNSIGAIVNFIDPRINEERIEYCMKSADTKMIVSVDTYNEKFNNVSNKLNIDDKMRISISPSDSLPFLLKSLYNLKVKTNNFKEIEKWKNFIKDGKNFKIEKSELLTGEEVAAIEYTSGTTGVPKGAILSNNSINSVAFQQKSVLPDMLPGDTFLDIMPPFIAYGLVCGMVASLTAGLELILIPKFDPMDFDKLVMKHQPNHVLGVPSFFENLTKSELVKNKDLSFIKYCIAGGDRMTVESEKRINSFFKESNIKNNIIKGYGMTELSSGVIINIDDNVNKLGSVGIPLIKNNVKILNPDTKEELGYDEVGEIYISGPSQMVGYNKETSELKSVLAPDGYGTSWIKTGDLGRVDKEGHIFVEGRIKRMIIRPDGHNVFPTAIENVILTHKAVDNCVVVGTKSKEYLNGEIPVAFITLKEEFVADADNIKEELKKLSAEKLPPRDVALDYEFVDFIPMTSVGKIDFNKLKENYEQKDKEKVK